MLSTWGTKLKGASDALGLVLWRKIANRKAVYSWSVFRMKRPPIKNNRESTFNVSSCKCYSHPKHCQTHCHSPHIQLRSYPCHISGDWPLSLRGTISILVFKTAQLFPVSICHDHNDLWDHLMCFPFSLSPSSWFPAHCFTSQVGIFLWKMHADELKRGFALKYRNERMWWHAGKREIRKET